MDGLIKTAMTDLQSARFSAAGSDQVTSCTQNQYLPSEDAMEQDLSREFLKVVEEAAIAAAKMMGIGDRKFADHAARTGDRYHGFDTEGSAISG